MEHHLGKSSFRVKPSGEFWNSLGLYVYGYQDPDSNTWEYIGKGVGDRAFHHVEDKGLLWENCYCIARNLEKFDDRNDPSSHAIESFLIDFFEPQLNRVSGRYQKECIVMASLSSMFTDFVAGQHDNFEAFPEWYHEHYDTLRGRLREIKITAGNVFLLSNARNAIYMMFYWDPNVEEVKVTFEVNQDGEKLENTKTQLAAWLSENGYDDTFPDGKKQKLACNVENIEKVMYLFGEFMS